MKGIRSIALPDLSQILVSKGFQTLSFAKCPLPSSHMHISALSRRFWKFLEFAHKDEACHDAEKCPSSKGLASPSLLKTDELDGISKNFPPNDVFSPAMSSPSKCHGYTFDLRSTPMTCTKVHKPVQQACLISLLDGNPVPRTLKWKLKGYKTLRNEQAGDFAFVPGEKTREYDMLTRNEAAEPVASNTCASKPVADRAIVETEGGTGIVQGDPLRKTNRVIESKQAIRATKSDEVEKKIVELDKPDCNLASSNLNRAPVISTGQTDVAGSVAIEERAKFLAVSKSELSVSQSSYQTQPAAQYSSRPSKGLWKPSAPVLRQTAGKRSEENVGQRVVKQTPKRQPVQTSSAAEDGSNVNAAGQQNPETHGHPEQPSSMSYSEESRDSPLSEPRRGSYREEQTSMKPAETREPVGTADATPQDDRRTETYFAPRAGARVARSRSAQNSPGTESKLAYESIIGIPPRPYPAVNIPNPGETQGADTSPCAATHARLQQVSAGGRRDNYQGGGLGGNKSPMGAGNSGRGSGKPPGSLPPFATRHSSSNTFCLTKGAGVAREADTGSRASAPSRTPSSSISTSGASQGRRRCDDGDEGDDGCSRRRSCKPRRQCQQERPRCQQERPKCRQERPKCKRERKDKQVCKRYCCPELQVPQGCDFSQPQCPGARPLPPKIDDPTCRRDNKRDKDGGRQICTSPTRKRKQPRSCKREEQRCSRERRDRSCGQEQRGCQRRRSCSRQDCEQDQGRTICTNPKRRENSCKRQRKCDDRDSKRSAKCTGRRHYTQLAYIRRAKSSKNIKRYSSAPAFVLPAVSIGIDGEAREKFLDLVPGGRFYGKDSKRPPSRCQKENKCKSSCGSEDDPCKATRGNCGTGKEDPCKRASKTGCGGKKEDPCKNVKKTGSSAKKKDDPCKRASKTSCGGKKEDPCKKASSCAKKKDDPCKKSSKTKCGAKKEDPCKKASKTSCGAKKKDICGSSKSSDSCAQKREKICKDRKLSESSAKESGKGRLERERKEMEECKKGSKDTARKKQKRANNLERVASPCKQQQNDGGSGCKFTGVDVPYSFTSSMSAAAIKQDGVKLFTIFPDRSYSTAVFSAFYNEFEPPASNEQTWRLEHDAFHAELYPVPVATEN